MVNYVYVTSMESATSTCVDVRRPSTSFREIQKIRATPLAVFIFSTDSLFMLFSPSLSVFTFYVSNEIWCCVLWSFFLEKDGLSTKRRGFHDQLFQNLVIWHSSKKSWNCRKYSNYSVLFDMPPYQHCPNEILLFSRVKSRCGTGFKTILLWHSWKKCQNWSRCKLWLWVELGFIFGSFWVYFEFILGSFLVHFWLIWGWSRVHFRLGS